MGDKALKLIIKIYAYTYLLFCLIAVVANLFIGDVSQVSLAIPLVFMTSPLILLGFVYNYNYPRASIYFIFIICILNFYYTIDAVTLTYRSFGLITGLVALLILFSAPTMIVVSTAKLFKTNS